MRQQYQIHQQPQDIQQDKAEHRKEDKLGYSLRPADKIPEQSLEVHQPDGDQVAAKGYPHRRVVLFNLVVDVKGSGQLVKEGENRQHHQAQGKESQGRVPFPPAGNGPGNQQPRRHIHPEPHGPAADILLLDDFLFHLELIQHRLVQQQPHQVQRHHPGQGIEGYPQQVKGKLSVEPQPAIADGQGKGLIHRPQENQNHPQQVAGQAQGFRQVPLFHDFPVNGMMRNQVPGQFGQEQDCHPQGHINQALGEKCQGTQ